MINKKDFDWQAIGIILVMVLAIIAIWDFFSNDKNQVVSARGKQVMDDDGLMQKVKDEIEKHEREGVPGPVVVNLQ
jgi:beta-lactam-binding protein with PASTA domain